jgi:hypothetical protein
MSMKKWVLIGLTLAVAVLIIAAIFYFTTTPGKIDQSQNRVKPVALNITPDAQKLQSTLDVADMHADSSVVEARPAGAVGSGAHRPAASDRRALRAPGLLVGDQIAQGTELRLQRR